MSDTLEQRAWLVAVAITLVGAYLRFDGVGTHWLNPDEGIYYSTLTWSDSARFWSEVTGNAHPPLYYLILRAIATVSDDFVAFRSVSVVCGTIAIPGTFLLVREAAGRDRAGAIGGLCTALFVALSPALIEMSQLMRPYMLQLMALTLALTCLARYLSRGKPRTLAGYAGLLAVALLTHYSSLIAFGTICLLLAGMLVARRLTLVQARQLAWAHAVPLALILGLYFFHLRPQLIGSPLAAQALEGWLQPYMIRFPSQVWSQLYAFFHYLAPDLAGPVLVVFVAGIGIALWQRRTVVYALPISCWALAAIGAATQKYPFGASRHSIYLTAFLVLPVAYALGFGLGGRFRPALGTAVVLGALLAMRGTVNHVVGLGKAWTQVGREQTLTVSDVDLMRPHLRRMTETRGILLLSQQSYYTLLPFVRRERENAVLAGDGSFFRFGWGKRDVVVAQVWEFTISMDQIHMKEHLLTFIEKVEEQAPEIQLADRPVTMLFAGWSATTPALMLRADRDLPPRFRLISNATGVSGLFGFDFKLGEYYRQMREAREQRGK